MVPRDKVVVEVVEVMEADWAPWVEVEAMMTLPHFQPLIPYNQVRVASALLRG